ncbi:hypothetical protein HNW77_10755 [Komagataeibacter sp. AV436]|uniref:Transposase n=1 Tax=Komagataeibacter melomenusus TaxID=2766578 RepID=A0ABX2AF96_9PROT|nr:hypothetical protein [Komagataeibacter melomenusus]MBV1831023.1 hypothetical protein [Komagataeibacter melomenusus]NPC66865.1 hypothetical protein [Komagataeibacter melomenusus]
MAESPQGTPCSGVDFFHGNLAESPAQETADVKKGVKRILIMAVKSHLLSLCRNRKQDSQDGIFHAALWISLLTLAEIRRRNAESSFFRDLF